MKAKRSSNKLLSNTLMLYILTFSNYFFNFITVPYQTRVLGPIIYGRIGFATSLMLYFQLFLDFGFLMSATEEVAHSHNCKKKLSQIYSEICYCKLLLIGIGAIILFFLCQLIARFKEDVLLYWLYYFSISIYAFLPDYLYRGTENMKAITVRSVNIKLFFTLMIFVFLKTPDQYYIIPFLNMIGNIGAVIGTLFHVNKQLGLTFIKVPLSNIFSALKHSSPFFYSRIASSIYSATNTFIIGLIYGDNSPVVGFYSSSEKLITTAKQGVTPIIDSLYPHMVVTKDYRLFKKILLWGISLITAGCIMVWIFSTKICLLLFGPEFVDAGTYLRLMIPIVWFSFPGMLFGFPILSPLGLSKYANRSNIYGALVHISLLIILYFTNSLTAINICLITCITECFTMLFRIIVVILFTKKSKVKD